MVKDSKLISKTNIGEELNLSFTSGYNTGEIGGTTRTGTICLRQIGFAYCPICEKAVELVTFESAAELFRTDVQDITLLAKQGNLHRLHDRKGEILICNDSLFKCFDSRQTRLLDSHFTLNLRME